jgi:hypothetical protein
MLSGAGGRRQSRRVRMRENYPMSGSDATTRRIQLGVPGVMMRCTIAPCGGRVNRQSLVGGRLASSPLPLQYLDAHIIERHPSGVAN